MAATADANHRTVLPRDARSRDHIGGIGASRNHRGVPVVFVSSCFAGPPRDADAALAPLRQLGTPLVDLTDTASYVQAQSALDDLFPAGGRYYWKSHFFNELSDAAIATMVERVAQRPTPESVIYIRTLGGAVARVRPEETAYAHRAAS
jgi:hypothetical protein